jgi:SAM-dependent methyltransferase
MLAEARGKPGAEAIRFVAHDLHEPLPFPAAVFDLVVSGLVLEHLGDLAAFFGEVRRMLRPGGRGVVSAMHPAMLLRGSQARFTDPASGEVIQPGSYPHQLGDFVMAAVRAGLGLEGIEERAADAEFATASRAASTGGPWSWSSGWAPGVATPSFPADRIDHRLRLVPRLSRGALRSGAVREARREVFQSRPRRSRVRQLVDMTADGAVVPVSPVGTHSREPAEAVPTRLRRRWAYRASDNEEREMTGSGATLPRKGP